MNFYALDKNKNKVNIDDAKDNEEYFCEGCNEKLFIKAKYSRLKHPHFCHQKNTKCKIKEWPQHDMSDWHKEWQNLFPANNRECVLKKDKEQRRADIFIKNTIIEVQHSPISYKNFNNRNVFYTSLGYSVVWIFDANEKFLYDNLNKRPCMWKNVQNQFHNNDNFNGKLAIFLEYNEDGNTYLIKPKNITPNDIHIDEGFYFKKFSKEEFLKDFGVIVKENILSILEQKRDYDDNSNKTEYISNNYATRFRYNRRAIPADCMLNKITYNKRRGRH